MRSIILFLFVVLVVSFGIYEFGLNGLANRSLNSFSTIDFVFFGVAAVLVAILFGFIFISDARSFERLLFLFFTIAVIFAFTLAAIVWNKPNLGPVAILFSGLLATFGWVFGHFLSIHNHRKQHTLNILLQMRQSALFQKHRAIFHSRYPPGVEIPKEHCGQLFAERKPENYANEQTPFLDSALYILNYHEFVSAALRRDDIDKRLLELSLRGIMCGVYRQNIHLIEDVRAREEAELGSTSAYDNFLWLMKQWA